MEPMYYLAVCSLGKLQKNIPPRSAYLDSTDGLILEGKQEIARLGEWGKGLEGVIGERDRTIRDLQSKMRQEMDLRDRAIRELQNRLVQEVGLRDQLFRIPK